MVILAVLRSRRRRLEWRNRPGLSTLSRDDHAFIGPLPLDLENGVETDPDPFGRADETSDDTGDAQVPSVAHTVPFDVSEFVIPDFRPNFDTCKVDLRYLDIDFAHWRAPGMAAMMFTDGTEALTVFFQGLDVVPFDGVYVRFEHPRKGAQTYLLSELVDIGESEISVEAAGLKLDASRDAAGLQTGLDAGPVEFHNFDTTKECIEVFVPEDRLSTTAVSISSTPEGSDGLVLVDGQVAAILIGAVDAGPRNVKLVAVDQTAAA